MYVQVVGINIDSMLISIMNFAPQHNVNSMLIRHRPTPTIPNLHQKSTFMSKIQRWLHIFCYLGIHLALKPFLLDDSDISQAHFGLWTEVKMIEKWWRMVEEWLKNGRSGRTLRTYPAWKDTVLATLLLTFSSMMRWPTVELRQRKQWADAVPPNPELPNTCLKSLFSTNFPLLVWQLHRARETVEAGGGPGFDSQLGQT